MNQQAGTATCFWMTIGQLFERVSPLFTDCAEITKPDLDLRNLAAAGEVVRQAEQKHPVLQGF